MEIYESKSLSRVVSKSKLAPDWLRKSEQPIRNQDRKLTQLLTMTTTHKFPLQECLLPQACRDVRQKCWSGGKKSHLDDNSLRFN